MKLLQPLILSIGSCMIFSCGPTLKVSSDYDHSVDFSRYKTFALFNGGSPTVSPLNQARIIRSIRTEMKGKGFQEDSVSPDLLVNSLAIVKNEAEVNASKYKVGSVIIDVTDAATRKLLWQGIGNSKIDQPVENADVKIGQAIDKIMAGFPPGATK